MRLKCLTMICGVMAACFSLAVHAAPAAIKSVDIGLIENLNIDYVPIEPLPANSQVQVNEGGQLVTRDIRTLTNAQKLSILGDSRVIVQLAKVNNSGQLSYLTGKVTAETGDYVAYMDFSNFFIDDVLENGVEVGKARVGVGLRLIARITTRKRNIDLGSLLKIGFAANKGEVSGELEVRAIGITSNEILNLLPGTLPNLDESSIQRALESMAAIKTKIYDAGTSVQPRVMAIAPNPRRAEVETGFRQDK